MSITAGCDVGSLTSKAVILRHNRVISSTIIKSKARPIESAEKVMHMALDAAGLKMDDISYCVGTGYGRNNIAFAQETLSEIACHGRGAHFHAPSVKTVIDIGGQDCKAIKLDSAGNVVNFVTNDKCASGTGRFLEVMSNVLGIGIGELGKRSLRSKSPIIFASTCTVWAQADVIQHLNDKVPLEDIAAGVNTAMAGRMAMLVNALSVENDVMMTGGVAKNQGVVRSLEKMLNVKIKKMRTDPQAAGALGAAIYAQDKIKGAQ